MSHTRPPRSLFFFKTSRPGRADPAPIHGAKPTDSGRRGWSYLLRTTGHEDKPPWWRKVFAIRDLLVNDPQPDELLVLWLDSDAHMTECTGIDPVQLAQRDAAACMWISPDAPPPPHRSLQRRGVPRSR